MLRTLCALAIAFGMIGAPAALSTSHDPLALAAAEAHRHAELAAEIAEHGHSHDDGEAGEQIPGHSHGHNAADHIHDKAGAPPVFASLMTLATHEVRLTAHTEVGRGTPAFDLKRPPRSVFAA